MTKSVNDSAMLLLLILVLSMMAFSISEQLASKKEIEPGCPKCSRGFLKTNHCEFQDFMSCSQYCESATKEDRIGWKQQSIIFYCKIDDGNYLKTLFGALFISKKRATWQGASDECCARGGHLISFVYPADFKSSKIIAHNTESSNAKSDGSSSSAGSSKAVWCLPGANYVSIKSPLSAVDYKAWNLTTSNSRTCASYKMLRTYYGETLETFKLLNCTYKLRYICKIEISFPDSCMHPFYIDAQNQHLKTFHWKVWTPLKAPIKRNLQIAYNASNANRDPGQTYYFMCGSKIFMGIMDEFSRIGAIDRCEISNFQLLSVDTSTEMECIMHFFKGGCGFTSNFSVVLNNCTTIRYQSAYKYVGTMSSSYWTSGVNFGTKNATTYGWCSTGNMVNTKLWAEKEPLNTESNRCVALTIMEDEPKLSGLEAVYCDFLMPLICQYTL